MKAHARLICENKISAALLNFVKKATLPLFLQSYGSAASFTYTVGDPASFFVKSFYRYAGMSLLAALISN